MKKKEPITLTPVPETPIYFHKFFSFHFFLLLTYQMKRKRRERMK